MDAQSELSLNRIVIKNLRRTTLWLSVVFCGVLLVAQLFNAYIRGRKNAYTTIGQVMQLLEENNKELMKILEEYRITCLNNAEIIAYMIERDHSLDGSVEELREIARMLEIDEIHIFDQTGTIIKGTHPKYYGYSFESGGQMAFFAPLLEDKTLKLCQDITPNTAEGKLMQYSALWSGDGEFIVQVGMEPASAIRTMKKNELSYIFSLLYRVMENDLYAINIETGIIQGATNSAHVGQSMEDIGLHHIQAGKGNGDLLAIVNGKLSYCVYQNIGDTVVIDVMPVTYLCEGVFFSTILMGIGILVTALLLQKVSTKQMGRLIVQGIVDVNNTLKRIAEEGEVIAVDVKTCRELEELGRHINEMTNRMVDMRLQIERQRDRDVLTGLYNRYGLENRIKELFRNPKEMKHAALVMVDADDLKYINDFYGHEQGDAYLKALAKSLADMNNKNILATRYGGDEFILFFYQEKSEEDLKRALGNLNELQDTSVIELSAEISVPLRFSYGISIFRKGITYDNMLREADKNMYDNKRKRKGYPR